MPGATTRTLMIVGGGYWQTFMIRHARNMGIRTVVVEGNPNAPGRDIADVFHTVNERNFEAVADVGLCERIDGVATFGTNDAMITVAQVTKALGLPSDGVSASVAERAIFKDSMRTRLIECGVATPWGIQVTEDNVGDVAAVRDMLREIDAPILIKPSDASGGKGASIVREPGDVERAIRMAGSVSYNRKLIAEEYVSGSVIGVESVTQHGRCIPITIADKDIGAPPYCVTIGVIAPSSLPQSIQNRVLDTNAAAIKALEIDTGPTHIDMVIGEDGIPKVIDVGPRLAGGPITFEIIPRTMRIDLMTYVVKAAFGQLAPIEPKWTGIYAGSRHILPPNSGMLKKLSCPEKLREKHRVSYLHMWRTPGERILPAVDRSQALGFAVCLGDTFAEARSNGIQLAESLEVEIDSDET
jgi:biotin carboxylase